MPVTLEGSCRCGAARFSVASHAPYPYMRCYCSICRKIAGGGGYAVNIMGAADTLTLPERTAIREIRFEIGGRLSPMTRSFCRICATALWGWHPAYPELVHPFAAAIDTELPAPPARTHIMLDFKASWVEPHIRDGDRTFGRYPDQSIEDWHRGRNLWID